MISSIFSQFITKAEANDKWNFYGPKKNGLTTKGGSWRFGEKETPTKKTGPSKGQSHGYVYTESSSPTQANDMFSMVSKDIFNAKDSEITVSYWFNSNTEKPITLEVFGWNGSKWILEDKVISELGELIDIWVERSFKIETYSNTDCQIKFVVTMPDSGKIYRNDFGLDSITISTSDTDNDGINNFLDTRGIHKRRKFGYKFLGKEKSKPDFDIILSAFKNNLSTFDFTKYPKGLVIEESQNIMHVFSKKDQ